MTTMFPTYKKAAVADLIPYARNSRTHSDAQVAQIAASIREFGFTNPVLVDAHGGIIAGHGRVMAARKLGMAEVPVIELDHLTPAQKRAYVIADNKLALEWIEPDWVFDTASGKFQRGSLWRRPKFDVQVWQVPDKRYWHLFEPHYYLKLPSMIAAQYYVGTVDGEPVAHIGFSPRLEVNGMRASRMVVMPEWQGAGIGLRFLNTVCEIQTSGAGKYGERVKAVYFHTSHPGLCAGLRRDSRWRQVSAELFGTNKKKSASSIKKSAGAIASVGYGGHFRAVQGFKYVGERAKS